MKKNKNITKKVAIHNGIIETPIPYTALEMKVFLVLAHKLQSKKYELFRYENTDFNDAITFKAKDIAEITGMTKNSYKNFKKILDALLTTVIVIPSPTETDPTSCLKMHFLRAVNYTDGLVTILPEALMIPFYIKLVDNFTSLELEVLNKFKSTHSIKVYSLIKQYKNLSKERKFLINDLKYKLGIENKYSSIKDFKLNVLDVVKKEINIILEGIDFDYELKRTGREFNEIIFKYDFFGIKQKGIDVIDLSDKKTIAYLHRQSVICILNKKNNNEVCELEYSDIEAGNHQCNFCIENNMRANFIRTL